MSPERLRRGYNDPRLQLLFTMAGYVSLAQMIYTGFSPRMKATFVGTIRYSSVRAHELKEQTPADDIISVVYVVAELISGR